MSYLQERQFQRPPHSDWLVLQLSHTKFDPPYPSLEHDHTSWWPFLQENLLPLADSGAARQFMQTSYLQDLQFHLP